MPLPTNVPVFKREVRPNFSLSVFFNETLKGKKEERMTNVERSKITLSLVMIEKKLSTQNFVTNSEMMYDVM